jgi:phosphatidate cytidylyltransferase
MLLAIPNYSIIKSSTNNTKFNRIAYPLVCILISFVLTSFSYLMIVRGFTTCIFVLLLPILADTFAYFSGIFLGKRNSDGRPIHPMAPNLSPKKSIEGLVGTLILTTLAMAGFI